MSTMVDQETAARLERLEQRVEELSRELEDECQFTGALDETLTRLWERLEQRR